MPIHALLCRDESTKKLVLVTQTKDGEESSESNEKMGFSNEDVDTPTVSRVSP